MSENINIVARRIFNKLSEDISDRRGLNQEWSSISPNVMRLEIRRTWEQIFTEEIEKHTTELQARVKRLEEAGDSLESDKKALKKILSELGVVGSMGFGSTLKWNAAKEAKP